MPLRDHLHAQCQKLFRFRIRQLPAGLPEVLFQRQARRPPQALQQTVGHLVQLKKSGPDPSGRDRPPNRPVQREPCCAENPGRCGVPRSGGSTAGQRAKGAAGPSPQSPEARPAVPPRRPSAPAREETADRPSIAALGRAYAARACQLTIGIVGCRKTGWKAPAAWAMLARIPLATSKSVGRQRASTITHEVTPCFAAIAEKK